mmetsp:Transcript_1156/g.2564  ORF Transcript_1156/g.2564 Transcript_1156/m.2564 type:complete len:171 (+) Transcript_1156:247-759(+)
MLSQHKGGPLPLSTSVQAISCRCRLSELQRTHNYRKGGQPSEHKGRVSTIRDGGRCSRQSEDQRDNPVLPLCRMLRLKGEEAQAVSTRPVSIEGTYFIRIRVISQFLFTSSWLEKTGQAPTDAGFHTLCQQSLSSSVPIGGHRKSEARRGEQKCSLLELPVHQRLSILRC